MTGSKVQKLSKDLKEVVQRIHTDAAYSIVNIGCGNSQDEPIVLIKWKLISDWTPKSSICKRDDECPPNKDFVNNCVVKVIISDVCEGEVNMTKGHINFVDGLGDYCNHFCSYWRGESEVKTNNINKDRMNVVA